MAAALDTDKCERKVWIIRVPPYVAQRWRQAIAGANASGVDEDATGDVLGQITLEQGVATTLQLDQPGSSEKLVLHMNSNRDTVDTAIVSYDPTAEPAAAAPAAAGAAAAKAAAAAGGVTSIKDPRVDGVVHKRYDAAPMRISDVGHSELNAPLSGLNADQIKRDAEQRQRAAAAMQAESAYLQNSRKRLAAASRPSKAAKITLIEDPREVRRLAGGADNAPVYQRKREEKSAVAEVKRRVRMSRDELEAELFKKFAEQPHWHFVQLQKELDQPVSYLKEVLNEVASQVKRGPNKDLWELKKHLVTSSTAPQQPGQG